MDLFTMLWRNPRYQLGEFVHIEPRLPNFLSFWNPLKAQLILRITRIQSAGSLFLLRDVSLLFCGSCVLFAGNNYATIRLPSEIQASATRLPNFAPQYATYGAYIFAAVPKVFLALESAPGIRRNEFLRAPSQSWNGRCILRPPALFLRAWVPRDILICAAMVVPNRANPKKPQKKQKTQN